MVLPTVALALLTVTSTVSPQLGDTSPAPPGCLDPKGYRACVSAGAGNSLRREPNLLVEFPFLFPFPVHSFYFPFSIVMTFQGIKALISFCYAHGLAPTARKNTVQETRSKCRRYQGILKERGLSSKPERSRLRAKNRFILGSWRAACGRTRHCPQKS